MSEIENKATEIIKKQDGIVSLFLFGSEASGKVHNSSDVDLAILFSHDKIPDSMKMIELRESLSEGLKRDIDLVCLNTASPIIGVQVIKNGKQLFTNDQKIYDKYVIDLLTDYADLKRLRRPIEESILKRKYYG